MSFILIPEAQELKDQWFKSSYKFEDAKAKSVDVQGQEKMDVAPQSANGTFLHLFCFNWILTGFMVSISMWKDRLYSVSWFRC